MPDQKDKPDYDALIPELRLWNAGKGIDIDGWLAGVGSYEHAIAYTRLFWPAFTIHEDCVLFAEFSPESFRGFVAHTSGDKRRVEVVMNHRHILDLFPNVPQETIKGLMRTQVVAACVLSLLLLTPAFSMSKRERAKLEAEIRAMDKNQIHQMVVAVEADPLSKMAEETRPALIIYFEPIDYTVCLDQVGFLTHEDARPLLPVMWQVVFSSGDFFLQKPEESKNRLTYMLAGLEGGLRVYERK